MKKFKCASHFQITGSGLQENKSSSRGYSGFERKHLCLVIRFNIQTSISNYCVNSTKRSYSENQYREITTANWGPCLPPTNHFTFTDLWPVGMGDNCTTTIVNSILSMNCLQKPCRWSSLRNGRFMESSRTQCLLGPRNHEYFESLAK